MGGAAPMRLSASLLLAPSEVIFFFNFKKKVIFLKRFFSFEGFFFQILEKMDGSAAPSPRRGERRDRKWCFCPYTH